MQEDEAALYDFATALYRDKKVTDAVYKAAVGKFGERGMMDIIGIIGYYDLVSMTLITMQARRQTTACRHCRCCRSRYRFREAELSIRSRPSIPTWRLAAGPSKPCLDRSDRPSKPDGKLLATFATHIGGHDQRPLYRIERAQGGQGTPATFRCLDVLECILLQ